MKYRIRSINLDGSRSNVIAASTEGEGLEAVKAKYEKDHPSAVALCVEPLTSDELMQEHEKWVDSQAGIGYFRKHGNLTLSDTSEQYARREDSGRY
jgi:hypothetical protein